MSSTSIADSDCISGGFEVGVECTRVPSIRYIKIIHSDGDKKMHKNI